MSWIILVRILVWSSLTTVGLPEYFQPTKSEFQLLTLVKQYSQLLHHLHKLIFFIFCTVVFFFLSGNKRQTNSKNIFFIFTFNTKTFKICNQHMNHTEKSVEVSPFRIRIHKFQPCVKLNHLFKCYKIK